MIEETEHRPIAKEDDTLGLSSTDLANISLKLMIWQQQRRQNEQVYFSKTVKAIDEE
jgi:hypothetical protein